MSILSGAGAADKPGSRCEPAETRPVPLCRPSLYEVQLMDIDIVSQVVANLGFPIACVIVMFVMWNKEREDHKTEADKWVQAINNNTLVMEKLLERLNK